MQAVDRMAEQVVHPQLYSRRLLWCWRWRPRLAVPAAACSLQLKVKAAFQCCCKPEALQCEYSRKDCRASCSSPASQQQTAVALALGALLGSSCSRLCLQLKVKAAMQSCCKPEAFQCGCSRKDFRASCLSPAAQLIMCAGLGHTCSRPLQLNRGYLLALLQAGDTAVRR